MENVLFTSALQCVSAKGATFILLLHDYRSLIKKASGVKKENAAPRFLHSNLACAASLF